jgi:hypothetical protein
MFWPDSRVKIFLNQQNARPRPKDRENALPEKSILRLRRITFAKPFQTYRRRALRSRFTALIASSFVGCLTLLHGGQKFWTFLLDKPVPLTHKVLLE